jgi:hypothetical protein
MTISSKDVALLWGRAAGRCSHPGCNEECIRFLAQAATSIGEMAHIIARSPKGRRGIKDGGGNVYGNLILLCPTHHTLIDKAPEGTFPVELLREWKALHEQKVDDSLKSPHFESVKDASIYIANLLIENRAVWETYGPESSEAKRNPISTSSEMWHLRKLEQIVPNNRRIINTINRNSKLFNVKDYELARRFIEHAEGFERSSYVRLEGVPKFPTDFREMIYGQTGVQ